MIDAAKRILVVDDESIILMALKETLVPEGFEVDTTNDPKTAIERVKERPYSVIISDQRMPEITGLELFQQVKQIQPEATRILITGVLTLNTVIDAVNKGEIYRFLAKPWIREELIVTVHNAHQQYQLIQSNRALQEDTLRLNDELAVVNQKLEDQLTELESTHDKLDKAHLAMSRNFEHSLQVAFRMIETYHPLLGRETQQIVELVQHLIHEGKLSPEEAHTLKVSAWLKNIGLFGVHREIIQKFRQHPESLTEEERYAIEKAPATAKRLAGFVDSLQNVGQTLKSQYERWDGRGFPDGLAGELIPKTARLLAVAAFYAESGHSKEETLERLLDESGKRFEPDAVRLFLKAIKPSKLPRQIREILLSELRDGMTLARDLYSPSGLLLFPEGKVINAFILKKIREFNGVNPITTRILVYC